jgi:hypothetical protein
MKQPMRGAALSHLEAVAGGCAAAVYRSWWKEPTKDQWFAWIAAWLGWMLDGFDYTVFLFIVVPIAKEFGVSVTAVKALPRLRVVVARQEFRV